MTSSELRECADYIERLCIVACRKRVTHVACDNCRAHAEKLRAFARHIDISDPRSSLFPPNKKRHGREPRPPFPAEQETAQVSG